jgi:hypothetical protein
MSPRAMQKLSTPNFKPVEFDRFRTDAGTNDFVLSDNNIKRLK